MAAIDTPKIYKLCQKLEFFLTNFRFVLVYHRKRPKCVERAVLLDIPPLYNCVRNNFDTSDDISVVLLEGNTRYHASLIGTEETLMIYR